jgi:hypothetical protein
MRVDLCLDRFSVAVRRSDAGCVTRLRRQLSIRSTDRGSETGILQTLHRRVASVRRKRQNSGVIDRARRRLMGVCALLYVRRPRFVDTPGSLVDDS